MTDRPDFPTTPGSLIRATAGADPDQILFMRASTEPDPAPWWVSSDGGWYSQANLHLIDVLHDEGYAQLLESLPAWGELSDVDKGCALQYAAKRDNEGRDYATEEYPARFLDHPVLTALKPGDACAFVDRFGFELWADGWHGTGDNIVVSNEDDDRLCKLARDAERARRRGDAS